MKDKKLFISIVSIFTIISFMIGVSYAYFVPIIIGNDTASAHNTKAGTLKLTYNGTNVLNLNNAQPGDSTSTTFTVTNSGTLPVNNYEIYFSKLINTFINNEVVYTLTCLSSDTTNCLGKEQNPVPTTEELSLTQEIIAPGTTHTYTLTVTFINKDEQQNYNQGKELKFMMTINEMSQRLPVVLIAGLNDEYIPPQNLFWDPENRENISEITFDSTINIPENAFKFWDISQSQDGSIMAYLIDDGLGKETYHLHIQSDQKIYANSNSKGLFSDFIKLTNINNLYMLNTSSVTDMSFMFSDCYSLTGVDLSNFNTSNVTNMSHMFVGCRSLISLDLSNFNTSNVTDMSWMFAGQGIDEWHEDMNFANLNLSNFDTSNVTNMERMFAGCKGLTSLDLSNFITSNVTTMRSMFNSFRSPINLDLSSFDTSNVADMSSMFRFCGKLTSLDLSSFDTSNVTDMSSMFRSCEKLTSLDLSSFNTSSVTGMFSMFSGCSGLTDLNLHNATFTSVTSYNYMFTNITNGINIIVKDAASQTFINNRLSEASKTGNVTIYVP